ncbi:MAG: rRNA maturation RNase YbeY [Nevskiales bacterium]
MPTLAQFRRWTLAALPQRHDDAELSIRIVTASESRRLNTRYRGQDKPTNVLSFPCPMPAAPKLTALGDLVICAQVVAREAKQQGKCVEAHWAHMTVHGVLHLLGYDHQKKHRAERMEALETDILTRLGYPDPYQLPQGKAA